MSRAQGWLPTLAGLALAHAPGPAFGQVTLDGTANPNFEGPLDGPDYQIRAELGRRADRNLFHSFEQFELRTLDDGRIESATFSGPPEIDNVISRVTGGDRSDINGAIRSTIEGADFFFLNPAGVMFGPNASLDVQGSFHVSTADELRFANGDRFSARLAGASTFTIARPEAFGFLSAEPGAITVNGIEELLVAPDDGTFSLVGGDISIDRSFIALRDFETRNGNVTLVAMSRPGAVAVAGGRTSAAPQGEIVVTGEPGPEGELLHGVDAGSFAGGGVVRIRAGALVVDDAFILAHNFQGETGSATALIDIEADRVRLTGGAEVGSTAFDAGNAGDVVVRAGELEVSSGALLQSNTEAAGNAGDVVVRAGELEVLSGALLQSVTQGAGNAGDVSVLGARSVLVSREGTGEPTDIISLVLVPEATGDAGTVTVESDEITVRDSGTIFSVTFGAGDSGRVAVTADRVAVLAGGQIGSGTLGQSTGRGGEVNVAVGEELVIAGESIRNNPITGTPEPSGIFTSTESGSAMAGPAGRVVVEAPVIRLADRGEIASESMEVGDGTNPADSGSVEVRFVELLEVDDAEITTKAEISDAGDIAIQGRGVIDVRNGGQISTTVFEEDSEGNAGDITIDPRFIILDAGRIQANGRRGQGGNIDITVDNLIQSPDSVIEALSELGIDGTVVIRTPEVDLSGGLIVLEGALLDAASQLRERCEARRDIGASSFTGVGRGGLPPTPDGPLASAYVVAEGAVGEARKTGLRPTEEAAAASSVRLAGLSAPCVPLD